jgi:Fe-S cluster assembly protein SufD
MKRTREIEKAVRWYENKFGEFENRLNGEKEKFTHTLRRQGISKLEEVGFPTLKTEEWKYTNINPIIKNEFEPITGKSKANFDLSEKFLTGFESEQLAFYNGTLQENISTLSGLPGGVIIDSLRNATVKFPDLVKKHLGKYLKINSGFDAINTAYLNDGFFIYLPKNTIIEIPLQILFYTNVENGLVTYRNLIVTEENSEAKIIFNHTGESEKKYFVNSVNEIAVGKNSSLRFYSLQSESEKAYHIEKSEVKINNSGTFKHYSFSFGGKIARNDIHAHLDGENITCNLYGLYLGKDKQHIDNNTFINHSKPNSFSEELYKGILGNESHGVFSGKILVSPDAQKTDAYQSNKTVLLSDLATIDTKPQLEIYADDVKCSHGATVGRLDEEQFFYIISRGIPRNIARSMLIRAFANDVIAKVEIEKLRELFNQRILEHLNGI